MGYYLAKVWYTLEKGKREKRHMDYQELLRKRDAYQEGKHLIPEICDSAHRLATYYGEKGFRFPTDRNRGHAGMSDIYWEYLTPSRAAYILKSPTYAGIYAYGRMQSCPAIAGNKRKAMPVENWHSYIEGHHVHAGR